MWVPCYPAGPTATGRLLCTACCTVLRATSIQKCRITAGLPPRPIPRFCLPGHSPRRDVEGVFGTHKVPRRQCATRRGRRRGSSFWAEAVRPMKRATLASYRASIFTCFHVFSSHPGWRFKRGQRLSIVSGALRPDDAPRSEASVRPQLALKEAVAIGAGFGFMLNFACNPSRLVSGFS